MGDLASLVAGAVGGWTETVTIKQLGGGTYNPATGEVTGESETTYTAPGIFTTYSDELIDGATIQSGDLHCELLANALTFTPQAGDALLRGTTRLEVVSVKIRPLKDETVSYGLQVRGIG